VDRAFCGYVAVHADVDDRQRGIHVRGAVILPNQEQVDVRDFPDPEPGHGQVVLRIMASAVCGSDLRAIYRKDAAAAAPEEEYKGVICGHEPAGIVESVGPGVRRFKPGDRVAVYHISGCGVCRDCRQGMMISCQLNRAAYGWQRDGGMGEFLLADEANCVPLPDPLSYMDGALIACGGGTAYEALLRVGVSGNDRVLITGLGPVGLSIGLIAQGLGAKQLIGIDLSEDRVRIAEEIGAITAGSAASGDDALDFIRQQTNGEYAEASFDASGNVYARTLALRGTRRWGRVSLVGMGGRLDIDVDEHMLLKQLTVYSSWVTTPGHMEDLCIRAARWGLHLDRMVTDRFMLEDADEAFKVANSGRSGKVCITAD
jgi:threonine dehydrogenase-like Zn-dependent dehydrogenase